MNQPILARRQMQSRKKSISGVDVRRADFAEAAIRASVGEVLGFATSCVRATAAVDDVVRRLGDAEGTLAVVDREHRFVGTVSDTALLGAVGKGACISDIMSTGVPSVSEDTPIAHAIALMAFENMHVVPVVAAAGKFVGLLHARDLLHWTAGHLGYVGDALVDESRAR